MHTAPRAERGSPRAHVRGLDGVRGLAVLVVVCFHLGAGVLPGGYLGVDVFFVLSGYLITKILLDERERTGGIDLKRFWMRRARRLLPALLSLMVAVALYASVLAPPEDLASLRRDALATLAYVANWNAIWSHKSYWELFAAPSPLEHTWSLAIEEQFYVLWPLCVLVAGWTLGPSRRRFAVVTLAVAVLSGVAMTLTFDPENTARAYFGTDTRAAAILLGAGYAAWPGRAVHARVRDALGILALLGLGAACVLLEGHDPWLYRGGFWLSELGALALIGCANARGPSVVERLLALRPLTYLGTISYGVYLWHWPVFCVLTQERVHCAVLTLVALRILVTLVIAVVSFHVLERPIRERGLPGKAPLRTGVLAFGVCVALVAVATRPRAHVTASSALATSAETPAQVPAVPAAALDMPTLPAANDLPPGTRRILVLGDSVAQALGVALRRQQAAFGAFVAERGVGDCSIMEKRKGLQRGQELGHPDPAHGCAAHWVADVAELQPDVTLIVVGGAFMTPMTIDRKVVMACDAGWQEFYRARVHQLLGEMGPSAGRVVLATTPAPGLRWRERDTLRWVECLNVGLSAVASQRAVPVLDLADHLCPGHACRLLSSGESGEPIRPDGLHPQGPGADELARWVLQKLRELETAR